MVLLLNQILKSMELFKASEQWIQVDVLLDSNHPDEMV